jgi:hypothetical protein
VWDFAADSHLLKLQRLQSRVLLTTGGLPRCTPACALYRIFQIPYVYDYIAKICRKQAEVMQTHDNVNVRNTGKNEAQHMQHKRLKCDGGQVYDNSDVWTAVKYKPLAWSAVHCPGWQAWHVHIPLYIMILAVVLMIITKYQNRIDIHTKVWTYTQHKDCDPCTWQPRPPPVRVDDPRKTIPKFSSKLK